MKNCDICGELEGGYNCECNELCLDCDKPMKDCECFEECDLINDNKQPQTKILARIPYENVLSEFLKVELPEGMAMDLDCDNKELRIIRLV